MLLAVPGPQVLSMLLAAKPDAQPPAGHQLRGCWRASWKVLDLPEEQFCRRFLHVVQVQQGLFFSYGLPCSQDRDPNGLEMP